MFRRRPIRRILRPLRRLARSSRRPPRELIRANKKLKSENYADAAEQFEALARESEATGSRFAPQLYLQAGYARISSGLVQDGLAHLKHGLSLLADRGAWLRLHRAGRRVVGELQQRGLAEEAGQISTFLSSSLPGDFSAPAETGKPLLPPHCPSCGAGLRPEEVEWLDEFTAECAYCGSPVRVEN